MANESYKTKVEFGVAAVVALVGTFFIFQALTIRVSSEAVGPRTMPMTLAIALVLGAFWLAVRAFRGKFGELKADYGFLDSDMKRITLVIGCGVLFVFSILGIWLFHRNSCGLYFDPPRLWRKGKSQGCWVCNNYGSGFPMAVHGCHASK